MPTTNRVLTPKSVLADLFEQEEFHTPYHAEKAADIVLRYLSDAGFEIISARQHQNEPADQ